MFVFFCVPRMIKHDVSLVFPPSPQSLRAKAPFSRSPSTPIARGAIELCGQGGFPSWWCSWTSTLVSCLSLIVQSDTNPTEHGCYCPGIMSRHCFWLAYCWNPVLGRNRYAHTHIFPYISHICTPLKFNSSLLKSDGWKMILSFLGWFIFRANC